VIRYSWITGAVLAGGRARRMGGADKALLKVGTGATPQTRTILSGILETFQERFAETIVVTSRGNAAGGVYGGYSVRVVADQFENCGPLGGIHAALTAATTPMVFTCGCDMPHLSGPLIDFMAGNAVPAVPTAAGRLLVPVVDGRPEPLHAIYPRSCLADVDLALRDGVRMMVEFFQRVPVEWLPQDRFIHIEGAIKSFRNLNTPEDLEAER